MSAEGGPLHGTGRLLRLRWRTSWLLLLGTAVALAMLVVSIAVSITALYDTPAKLREYSVSMELTPLGPALNGRVHDLDTVGGVVSVEEGFTAMLGLSLVLLQVAVTLTRRQEDAGRTELTTAGPVGPLATLASAVVALLGVVGLFAALTWPGLVVLAGLPAAGATPYVGSLALFALLWATVGLVLAEVGGSGRTAGGVGAGLALGLYLLKVLVDVREGSVVASGPLGWLADVRPWGDAPRTWPLVAYALGSCALLLLLVPVAAHRDLGAGLLRSVPGRGSARRYLGHPAGLAWRLTRGSFLGWLTGLLVIGFGLGSLAQQLTAVMAANPSYLEVLGITDAADFTNAITGAMLALLALALVLQVLSELGREEEAGRLGLVLATPRTPRAVWSTWWLVAVGEVASAYAAGLLALGAGSWWATGRDDAFAGALDAGLAYLVPVVALASLALLVRVTEPRAYGLLWLALAWAAVVTMLADTLRLAEWARDLSAFHLVGTLPTEGPDVVALWSLGAATVALVLLSLGVVQHRDLRAG